MPLYLNEKEVLFFYEYMNRRKYLRDKLYLIWTPAMKYFRQKNLLEDPQRLLDSGVYFFSILFVFFNDT